MGKNALSPFLIRGLLSFILFFGGGTQVRALDQAAAAPLETLQKQKKKVTPGRDWQELKRLTEVFPKSLEMAYLKASRDLEALRKVPRSRQSSPSFRRQYEQAVTQQRYASGRMAALKRELGEWVELVQLKLQEGLYATDRHDFYRALLPTIKKYVYDKLGKGGVAALHSYVANLSAPTNAGASFDERFLKPKYAEEYRLSKLTFYTTYQERLRASKKEALAKKDTAAVKSLDQKLKEIAQKIEKWRDRSVGDQVKSYTRFTPDRLMGIEEVKELGYTGRHVLIGIIEPQASGPAATPHQDLQKRLVKGSRALSAEHATHVSGIVGARARTIFDRVGTAPKANLLFMMAPYDRQPRILYTTPKGQTLKPSRNEKRTLVGSAPSGPMDKAMARLLEAVTESGVRLLNMSMVYNVGPQTLKALKKYARKGGVIVKAAGNSGLTLAPKITIFKDTLSPTQEYQTGIDLGLFQEIMKDEALKKAFIFVGNLKTATQLDASSNKAGFVKERFVSAWGTDVLSTVGTKGRTRLTGTSMSAPIVTGSLALLQEAYPTCAPQALAQNLLDTATKIGRPDVVGQGRINVAAAFEMSAQSCGLPSPPRPKQTEAKQG